MADVLKTTNWWGSNPAAFTVTDLSGSGASAENRLMTATEAHDSLDTTYEEFIVSGDGISLDGNATAAGGAILTAATGGIAFLRVKFRARVIVTGGGATGGGSVQPLIAGTLRGTQQALTGAYVNYTQDIAVDPADGLPWTPAKVAAQSFGMLLAANAASATFLGVATLRVAEYTVEVWGTDATGAIVGASAQGVAAFDVSLGGGLSGDIAMRSPTDIVALASSVDNGSALVTLRSANATYRDQDVATFTTRNAGPSGGTTETIDLGGLLGATSINGSGTIGGVKLFALVRCSKNGGATMTNIRFGTGMGVQALLVAPTVNVQVGGSSASFPFVTAETALIALTPLAVPFEWGNGVNSVWSVFASPAWTLNFTWTGGGGGDQARCEVAEAWVEVHGPVGSEPTVIQLVHALNLAPLVQKLESTL